MEAIFATTSANVFRVTFNGVSGGCLYSEPNWRIFNQFLAPEKKKHYEKLTTNLACTRELK